MSDSLSDSLSGADPTERGERTVLLESDVGLSDVEELSLWDDEVDEEEFSDEWTTDKFPSTGSIPSKVSRWRKIESRLLLASREAESKFSDRFSSSFCKSQEESLGQQIVLNRCIRRKSSDVVDADSVVSRRSGRLMEAVEQRREVPGDRPGLGERKIPSCPLRFRNSVRISRMVTRFSDRSGSVWNRGRRINALGLGISDAEKTVPFRLSKLAPCLAAAICTLELLELLVVDARRWGVTDSRRPGENDTGATGAAGGVGSSCGCSGSEMFGRRLIVLRKIPYGTKARLSIFALRPNVPLMSRTFLYNLTSSLLSKKRVTHDFFQCRAFFLVQIHHSFE